jgi:hypothetical protein
MAREIRLTNPAIPQQPISAERQAKIRELLTGMLTSHSEKELRQSLIKISGAQPSEAMMNWAAKTQKRVKDIVFSTVPYSPSDLLRETTKLVRTEHGPETEFLMVLAYTFRELRQKDKFRFGIALRHPSTIRLRSISQTMGLEAN